MNYMIVIEFFGLPALVSTFKTSLLEIILRIVKFMIINQLIILIMIFY